jgi:hemerythrin
MQHEKSAANTLPWSDSLLLGFEEMDAIHREFVETANALIACDDAQFIERMDDFIEHATSHFGEEDAWMRATDFPAAQCHIDEHAQVMNSAIEVRHRALAGDLVTGRRFARELVSWFPGHADYLDSALAAWMVNRRHGGSPVVLRRRT